MIAAVQQEGNMTIEELCYVISIALQFSGSVLLLLYYWGRTKELIKELYFPGTNVVKQDDNDNVTLEKEKVLSVATQIYKNRTAFMMLAVGFLLGVFGSINQNSKLALLTAHRASVSNRPFLPPWSELS